MQTSFVRDYETGIYVCAPGARLMEQPLTLEVLKFMMGRNGERGLEFQFSLCRKISNVERILRMKDVTLIGHWVYANYEF